MLGPGVGAVHRTAVPGEVRVARYGRARLGPAVLCTAMFLVTAVTGCGSAPASAPSSSPSPATATAAQPPAALSAAPSSGRAAVQNLVVTSAVRGQLVKAYVTAHDYQPGWITGTEPGSVYYAYDPGTAIYLAWAGFVPAAAVPQQVLVGLQDDGARTAFHRTAGGSWQTYDICTTPAFFTLIGGRLPGGGTCPD